MTGTYRIHPLHVLEVPIINNVDKSDNNGSDSKDNSNIGKKTEGGKDKKSIEENMDGEMCENCHSPEAVEERSVNAEKEDDRKEATADADDGVAFNKIACLDINKELEDSGEDAEKTWGLCPFLLMLMTWIVSPL